MSTDEQAIREAIAAWLRASESGDLQTMLTLLADDVLFLVGGRAPFGKREFATENSGRAYKLEAKAEVREIGVHGDWAWTLCQVAVRMTPSKGAPEMRLAGPTLAVWKKNADGRWVIRRDANFVAPE